MEFNPPYMDSKGDWLTGARPSQSLERSHEIVREFLTMAMWDRVTHRALVDAVHGLMLKHKDLPSPLYVSCFLLPIMLYIICVTWGLTSAI
jgi:hypothetical protein